jgi:hypothetical protein
MNIDSNLAVPLGLAGVALAAAGVARLTGRVLTRMPRAVGVATIVAGTGVAASGFALHPSPPARTPPSPAASSSAGPAPVTGTISGSVHDAQDAPVAAATVVLRRFERTEEQDAARATTAPDGAFSFAGLQIGDTTAYVVSTDYDGTTFRSELVLLDPHASSRRVDIAVAQTTTDAESVSVTVDSTVLVGDRRGAQIVQIVSVRNDGARAYTGGLRLPLLPRAQELQPRSGLDQTRLSLESGELVSTAPVMPRTTQIVYEYAIPMPARGVDLTRVFRYPTKRFELLAGTGLDVRSHMLRPAGRVKLATRTYRSYSTRDVRPGARVRATIRVGGRSGPLRTGAIVAAIVVAVSAIAWPLYRRRPPVEP